MFHDSLGQKSEQYKAYFNEMMKNSRRAHNIHTKVLGSREEAPTAGLRDLELRLEGLLGEIDRTVVADCLCGPLLKQLSKRRPFSIREVAH